MPDERLNYIGLPPQEIRDNGRQEKRWTKFQKGL
jgi:hypothetical protein